MAISGLASEKDVLTDGAEIIAESYPDFTATLEGIGARVNFLS